MLEIFLYEKRKKKYKKRWILFSLFRESVNYCFKVIMCNNYQINDVLHILTGWSFSVEPVMCRHIQLLHRSTFFKQSTLVQFIVVCDGVAVAVLIAEGQTLSH